MNKSIFGWSALFAGPLFILSAYLVISRWPTRWFSASSDYAAIAIALVVGLFGLLFFSWPKWQKAVFTFCYLPIMGLLLTYYSLFFVCTTFGDCL